MKTHEKLSAALDDFRHDANLRESGTATQRAQTYLDASEARKRARINRICLRIALVLILVGPT